MSKFALTFVDNWFTLNSTPGASEEGPIGLEEPPEKPPMLPGQDKGEVNLEVIKSHWWDIQTL
jgi:hypothetical protein